MRRNGISVRSGGRRRVVAVAAAVVLVAAAAAAGGGYLLLRTIASPQHPIANAFLRRIVGKRGHFSGMIIKDRRKPYSQCSSRNRTDGNANSR